MSNAGAAAAVGLVAAAVAVPIVVFAAQPGGALAAPATRARGRGNTRISGRAWVALAAQPINGVAPGPGQPGIYNIPFSVTLTGPGGTPLPNQTILVSCEDSNGQLVGATQPVTTGVNGSVSGVLQGLNLIGGNTYQVAGAFVGTTVNGQVLRPGDRVRAVPGGFRRVGPARHHLHGNVGAPGEGPGQGRRGRAHPPAPSRGWGRRLRSDPAEARGEVRPQGLLHRGRRGRAPVPALPWIRRDAAVAVVAGVLHGLITRHPVVGRRGGPRLGRRHDQRRRRSPPDDSGRGRDLDGGGSGGPRSERGRQGGARPDPRLHRGLGASRGGLLGAPASTEEAKLVDGEGLRERDEGQAHLPRLRRGVVVRGVRVARPVRSDRSRRFDRRSSTSSGATDRRRPGTTGTCRSVSRSGARCCTVSTRSPTSSSRCGSTTRRRTRWTQDPAGGRGARRGPVDGPVAAEPPPDLVLLGDAVRRCPYGCGFETHGSTARARTTAMHRHKKVCPLRPGA